MKEQETQSEEIARLEQAAAWILDADRLVIGIGSGLSAAGGLCYADPALVRKWYPEYDQKWVCTPLWISRASIGGYLRPTGKDTGAFGRGTFGISAVKRPVRSRTGICWSCYRGRHIFVITTNCDSQVDKAGFPKQNIFAPQGNYGCLQCSRPCTQEVCSNEELVERMVRNIPDSFAVRPQDIPYCLKCGAPLVPNLRCDSIFVEQPHPVNWDRYEHFIQEERAQKTVFLELGVGFNTPMIIRFPFETLVSCFPTARMVRIDNIHADLPQTIRKQSLSIRADPARAMRELRDLCVGITFD